jgi:hypothetical protein
MVDVRIGLQGNIADQDIQPIIGAARRWAIVAEQGSGSPAAFD